MWKRLNLVTGEKQSLTPTGMSEKRLSRLPTAAKNTFRVSLTSIAWRHARVSNSISPRRGSENTPSKRDSFYRDLLVMACVVKWFSIFLFTVESHQLVVWCLVTNLSSKYFDEIKNHFRGIVSRPSAQSICVNLSALNLARASFLFVRFFINLASPLNFQKHNKTHFRLFLEVFNCPSDSTWSTRLLSHQFHNMECHHRFVRPARIKTVYTMLRRVKLGELGEARFVWLCKLRPS